MTTIICRTLLEGTKSGISLWRNPRRLASMSDVIADRAVDILTDRAFCIDHCPTRILCCSSLNACSAMQGNFNETRPVVLTTARSTAPGVAGHALIVLEDGSNDRWFRMYVALSRAI
ncbi:hypothetical protein JZU51_02210 [bacterium]|nr:hypothetical protein [bacterium]